MHCPLPAAAWRNLFVCSCQAGKKERNCKRAKQRQRILEVGTESCFVPPARRKGHTKTEQISCQRWDKLHRHPISNSGEPVGQTRKTKPQPCNQLLWLGNVHRLSKEKARVPRINLMLLESGERQHCCFVKRVSALLFDQTKNRNSKHFCMMCLSGFTERICLRTTKSNARG